jgi:prepilin-type N-terminal cleavage/methylation domain-containing protein
MSKRGFTLVEMIVSLAIFSVVAVVALTALMSIMSANRKAQTLQSAITNLSYAMESLSREMRVGINYYCSTGTGFSQWNNMIAVVPCPGVTGEVTNQSSADGAVIAFQSSNSAIDSSGDPCSLVHAYRFIEHAGGEGYQLEKAEQVACFGSPLNSNTFSSVVDEKVIITDFYIKIPPSRKYPYVILRISGYAGEREKDRTYFDLQTAVSARTVI